MKLQAELDYDYYRIIHIEDQKIIGWYFPNVDIFDLKFISIKRRDLNTLVKFLYKLKLEYDATR